MSRIARIVNFVFLLALLMLFCLNRGHDMRLAIVGSDVSALVLALKLVTDHEVVVIEQEAEIGMPVHHPGRVLDLDVLAKYIPLQHHEILQLQKNQTEFGCRWEWVVKLLTVECSRRDVRFMTRSRITSMTRKNGAFRLEFNNFRKGSFVEVDAIVDMNMVQGSGPGQRTHQLDVTGLVPWGKPETTLAQGILVPTVYLDGVDVHGADFVVSRADHQTELWWYQEPDWAPPHGVLERMQGHLPLNPRLVSFDGCVLLAERVHSGLKLEHI